MARPQCELRCPCRAWGKPIVVYWLEAKWIASSMGPEVEGNGRGYWMSCSPSCQDWIPDSRALWIGAGVFRVALRTDNTESHCWSLISWACLQQSTWLWVSECRWQQEQRGDGASLWQCRVLLAGHRLFWSLKDARQHSRERCWYSFSMESQSMLEKVVLSLKYLVDICFVL